jgi:hypothetical protein
MRTVLEHRRPETKQPDISPKPLTDHTMESTCPQCRTARPPLVPVALKVHNGKKSQVSPTRNIAAVPHNSHLTHSSRFSLFVSRGWYVKTTPPTPEMYQSRPMHKKQISSADASQASTNTTLSESSTATASQPNRVFQDLQERRHGNPYGWPGVPF